MKEFTVKIMDTDVPNQNGRIYPREAIQLAVDEVNNSANKSVFGTIGMPEGYVLNMKNISHEVSDLKVTETGELIGKVKILKTPKGAELEKLLSSGKLDFRSAGTGNVSEDGVVSNFSLISISAVYDGS